ncbi:MAG: BamA/TamA family outer membrane protein [Bacteroidota bacterium]|nr:BamA/TamA family outer membrane protein [Bacteroidota bacterium]
MLKYFPSYKRLPLAKLLSLLSVALILYSCNPTKYVPPDKTLLDKSEIKIENSKIKKSDLAPYVKQEPNKKIFGARFHLGLYNLSNIEKTGWPHSWLRNIGEEPVIFDPFAATKSSEQIENYLFSKGYFNAEVSTDIASHKQRTDVTYEVKANDPYRIRKLIYDIKDEKIRKLFFMDTINCLIKSGEKYDVDVLQSERIRLERFIKDMGFYSFSRDHIYFKVDSTVGNRQVDIFYEVRKFLRYNDGNRIIETPHQRYRINNVYIYTDFDPKRALDEGDAYLQKQDTTFMNDYYFLTDREKHSVKPNVVTQSLYVKPGDLFQVTNMERSQDHLNSLQAFRLVSIRYNEPDNITGWERDELPLNCVIRLTPVTLQEFRVELEGTNSAGNLGGAVNFVYQHNNLFRGAEQLNIKLKGAYETLSKQITGSRSLQEYGFETSLTLPRFMLPFLEKEGFIKRYNPKTIIAAAYNYQKMPVYTRTVANASFGYNWRGNRFTEHSVYPLQLNVVNLPFIDPDFEMNIDTSSYLAYSYKDVFLVGGNYIYVFNNQNIKKSKDYWFIKMTGELAGNLLSLGYKVAGADTVEGGNYEIFGQPFAQYARADMDMRYNRTLNKVSSVVYRGFIGVGIPYGNSKAVPFEKQYFSGGANSIRAWHVRSLGPGSYTPVDTSFYNMTADIKLEFNAEYRFKLFWILEGAMFLDVGNIWTFYEDEDRPGTQFKWNKFYRDLAVGTGLGLRFDLDFVILRADLGMKLRDPQLPDTPRWILQRRKLNFRNDFTLNISIGYPF